MTATLDFTTLNPEQLRAVEHDQGPLLVFAGAGSGKTRVITYRIARLILSGVPSYRILAVTFTNKAAKEMKERVEALIGPERTKSMWIGTFHSLCAKMLRIDGHAIGIASSFVIYDDQDQISLIKNLMKQKDIDDKAIQPRAILSEISKAKEKLLTPEQFSSHASNYFERIAADLYKSYNQKLHQSNALDFDDILYYCVRLLEQSETVRTKYQDKFLHVLVDEYQDVNFSQFRIVQLLAEKHKNIVVVGDDDQSIYAWRGADVSLILKFGVDYDNASVIKLEQNYRSTSRILAAANEVIRANPGRSGKSLWTENNPGTQVTVTRAGTEQDEAAMVADAVLKDVQKGRRSYSDFAILYRTNAQSRVIEESFLTSRIPHILIGGQRFYERKEIKDMVAYLRLVLNPMDDVSFRRVINTPPRGIGPGAIETADKFVTKYGGSLLQAVETQDVQADLSKKAMSSVRAFINALEMAKAAGEAANGRVTPMLKSLFTYTGYLDALRSDNSEEAKGRIENLQELLNVTGEFDFTQEEPSLGGFLESTALISDTDSLNQSGNAVTLMTIHSAKGLEFPVVFVIGMEEGVFPHSRSLQSDSEIAEERRLAYVAMTRAQQELHITHASRRSLYGTPNFNQRSRFLDDLEQESLATLTDALHAMPAGSYSPYQDRDRSYSSLSKGIRAGATSSESIASNISSKPKPPSWKPPFEVGQRVRHPKFGTGVVIACSPITDDAEVTVVFPGVIGVKKLIQKLAKLEAVL